MEEDVLRKMVQMGLEKRTICNALNGDKRTIFIFKECLRQMGPCPVDVPKRVSALVFNTAMKVSSSPLLAFKLPNDFIRKYLLTEKISTKKQLEAAFEYFKWADDSKTQDAVQAQVILSYCE